MAKYDNVDEEMTVDITLENDEVVTCAVITILEVDGKDYKGITNFGARPTFNNTQTPTETYLDGYASELYGKTLAVRFTRFLREITKFENATALQKQLQEDIRRVREND